MSAKPSILRRIDENGIGPLVIRLALGGYFVYMGVMKISDPVEFLKLVRLYGMLPETPPYLLNTTAIVLPWLEVVCGLALIVGIGIRGAGALIALMLAVFTPAIFLRAMAIHQAEGTPFLQIAFDCGCGTGVVVIWKKLLSNFICFGVAILAVLSRSRRFTLTHLLDLRRVAGTYCRRCGFPLPDGADEYCGNCREAAEVPAATSDATA